MVLQNCCVCDFVNKQVNQLVVINQRKLIVFNYFMLLN